jgi:hypothetical protein
MEDRTDAGSDAKQWWCLLGAMVASALVRKQAASILLSDVPKELQPLWTAVMSGDGNKVWGAVDALGLKPADGSEKGASVVSRLIHALQEKALARYVKTVVSQAEFSHKGILDPEQIADSFESIAAKIRQRKEVLSKPVKEGKE